MQLDANTVELVTKSWTALESRYSKTDAHWTDHESDVGPLKDADALLALLEPFTMARDSFPEPPLPYHEITSRAEGVFQLIAAAGNEGAPSGYQGFSAAPYSYTPERIDYVDSAATFLRLACELIEFAEALQQTPSQPLIETIRGAAQRAARFLVDSRIEDRHGVRWAGTALRPDAGASTANLFFTNVAALSLRRALNNPTVADWLSPAIAENIKAALLHVPKWVASQYAPNMQSFWMDEAQGIVQPIGTVYAIETIYGLLTEVPLPLRDNCMAALNAIAQKVPTVERASRLQTDFFHSVVLPAGTPIFYDDRRYIASFLGAFAIVKQRDKDAMTDNLIRVADILVEGVTREWVDASDLWDDGRPLICYTRDALTSLVQYFMAGVVPIISLRESSLREAVRLALASDGVIDEVVEQLRDRALGQRQQDVAATIAGARQGA